MSERKIGRGKNRCMGALLLLTLCIVICAQVASAQGIGSISGRASDSSGAVVSGAKVTVRNIETGEIRAANTDENGFYRVLTLPVGHYEVKVEKDGFKTELRSGIDLVVGQEAVVNISLEIGGLAQQVTVTEEAPLVNTTTAETLGLVNEAAVKDLPLNGRSFDNLISLNAGTVDFSSVHTTTSQYSGGLGKLFSISGRRPDANMFLLNGVQYEGNGRQADMPGSVSGQLLGIDAIREFNVLKDNYSAEYGKKFGGQISIVTMSGTNQIHGSAFEFLRNSALDARNFFDQPVASLGARIPHFERNNFGGSLGAPIKKDKTFIFGNFEGLEQLLGLSNTADVPDLSARSGLLPIGLNGALQKVTVAPGVLPYLAIYPLPNGPEVGGGVALFYNSPTQTIHEYFGTTRFDQIFSDKDSFNAVYTIDNGKGLTPQVTDTYITNLDYRAQILSLSEVHIFSPNLLNMFTAGLSRATFLAADTPLISVSPSLAFVAGQQIGQISIGASGGNNAGALSQIGAGNPAGSSRNLFTYADTMQLTHGKHLLSFGVWFQRVQDNAYQGANIGKATFSTLQTLLAGQMQTFQGIPNAIPLGFRSLEGAWFIEDTIKLRPNLTLDAGLRDEFTNGWSEQYGRLSRYVLGTTGVLQNQPIIGGNAFPTNNARFLLGPRLGLAWDIFGKGQTVVHAGFGMYYNLMDDLSFGGASNNPPFNTTIIISNSVFPFTQITPQNVSTLTGAQIAPGLWPPNMKTPVVTAYNLNIQQALGPNTVLTVGYEGNHTSHITMQYDTNPDVPVVCPTSPCPATLAPGTLYFPSPDTRKNPNFSISKIFDSSADSDYDGLVVDVTQRVKHGLMFRSNFTWSKALDDSSATGSYNNSTSELLNPFNPPQDWGYSTFNVKFRYSFSGSYQLPFGKGRAFWNNAGPMLDRLVGGWQLNSIVSIQTGLPLDPELGFNQSRDGDTNTPDRPSLNPNFTGNLYPHTVSGWYNAMAFELPAAGTYGNVSRNSLIGPGLADFDLSLFKDTTVTERLKMQFRAEGFNVLNRANFGIPNLLTLNPGADYTTSPRSTAGQITTTSTTSRQIQFGVKLIW